MLQKTEAEFTLVRKPQKRMTKSSSLFSDIGKKVKTQLSMAKPAIKQPKVVPKKNKGSRRKAKGSKNSNPQHTLLRVGKLIREINPPQVKKSFCDFLGLGTWYLTTKITELSIGNRLLHTIIRLLWCCKHLKIKINFHIPSWEFRYGYIATLAQKLMNNLPHLTWSDLYRSPRGRLRSATPIKVKRVQKRTPMPAWALNF